MPTKRSDVHQSGGTPVARATADNELTVEEGKALMVEIAAKRDGSPMGFGGILSFVGRPVTEVVCFRCGRLATDERDDWYVWADFERIASASALDPDSPVVYCCPDCMTDQDRESALRLGDLRTED